MLEEAKQLFSYDPQEGVVRTIKTGHCGCDNGEGYLIFRFLGRTTMAHRIAWLLTYGEMPDGNLDHTNGNKRDNRISNLRIATYQQNNANRRGWRRSISGAKGVSVKNGRWFAQIMINGKNIHLGYFETVEQGAEAYAEAAKRYFGEFARAA